jgi:hypothetical protein
VGGTRLRLEALASPVGGTNVVASFLYPEGRPGNERHLMIIAPMAISSALWQKEMHIF